MALFNSSYNTLNVISLTLSVELYAEPGVTIHIKYLSNFSSPGAMILIGTDFQFQILKIKKNYCRSFIGLWFGNIWQIFAIKIAQDIPPK